MSKDFLSAIIARKRQTVAELHANSEVTALRAQALKCREATAPHRLRDALETASPSLKIIAEFKRISPSRGLIRAGLPPAEVARAPSLSSPTKNISAVRSMTSSSYGPTRDCQFCARTSSLIRFKSTRQPSPARTPFF